MPDWLDTLISLRRACTPALLVTVASTKGSAPRDAGTKMVVTADAAFGTIGGGHLEHAAIAIARDQLAAARPGETPLRRFPLGASLGQCCGGVVNLLFEPIAADAPWIDVLADARRSGSDAVVVTPVRDTAAADKLVVTRDGAHGAIDAGLVDFARAALAESRMSTLAVVDGRSVLFDVVPACDFDIVLFGAGHVARALVRVLCELPCRITWVDEREDEFPGDAPANVTISCTDAPEADVDEAPAGAYFVVMTHSHALDEALAERILRRGDHAYFGLIGSATKRRAFERRIARRGVPPERLATMTCPIGIAGIPGKEPAAIAIAVAAEILQARARGAAARSADEARRA